MFENPQTVIEKLRAHSLFKDVDFLGMCQQHTSVSLLHSEPAALQGVLQFSTQINAIPPNGIIISQPGIYTLASDITWSPPSGSAATAITIVGNDITLDLGGHCLSAAIGDSSQAIVGIKVLGANGVSILQGTLANMGLYGIQATHVSALTIDGVTVTGVEYRNLNIRNATPCGIQVSFALGVSITNCTSQYFYTLSDSAAAFQLLGVLGGTVSGCIAANMVNYDGAVQGFNYLLCSDITTTNCTAQDFQSYFNGNIRTHGHTVLGFIPIACIGLSYIACSSTNMIGSCDDAHGMSVFLNALVTVEDFTATGVLDGPAPYNTGAKATGLEVYGIGISILNCTVSNITAINPQDKQAAGFSAWGTDISFSGCKATSVTVLDIAGNTGSEVGIGTGFGWAPDPRKMFCYVPATSVSYLGCMAVDCLVGFDTWNHISSTWTGNIAENCSVPVLIEGPDATRTLIGNPASECNPPIKVSLTNQARDNVINA